MRRQQEDESGLQNGLAGEARSPGSCTSICAMGCSLRGSAQILKLKVERSVLLKSVEAALLGCGEKVQGEPANSSSGATKA